MYYDKCFKFMKYLVKESNPIYHKRSGCNIAIDEDEDVYYLAKELNYRPKMQTPTLLD